jgi:hypothetical protein
LQWSASPLSFDGLVAKAIEAWGFASPRPVPRELASVLASVKDKGLRLALAGTDVAGALLGVVDDDHL